MMPKTTAVRVFCYAASFFALVAMGAFVGSSQAQAAKTGDMFNDSGWNVANRPRVPSDRHRGADMFPTKPPISKSEDVFDGMRLQTPWVPQDMLPHKRMVTPLTPLFRAGAYESEAQKEP